MGWEKERGGGERVREEERDTDRGRECRFLHGLATLIF